jgi:hypothetical protein
LNVQSLDSSGSGGGGGGTPPVVVAGAFTEDVRGNPSISVVGNGDAICTLEPNGYTCSVEASATSATLKVYDYGDTRATNPETRYACSDSLLIVTSSQTVGDNWTEFDLFSGGSIVTAGTAYDIRIQTEPCS